MAAFLALFALPLPLAFLPLCCCFLFLDRVWNRKALLNQARESGERKERHGVVGVVPTSAPCAVTYFSICVEDTPGLENWPQFRDTG